MKALIKIFLPLCIFSFIAFGISTAVLGVNPDADGSGLSESAGESSTTTLEGEFDSIDIDGGASRVTIRPHTEQYTEVTLNDQHYTKVNAKISGNTLKIYNEWNGTWGWLTNLFNGDIFHNAAAKITVLVPEKIYDELEVSCGAGVVVCDGIRASDVKLDVSAGEIKYTQPEDFAAQEVEMDVSAGSLKAYNVQTERYSINVSAGGADVSGLTGSGEIDVSAGSAKARLARLDGYCDIDVSAGEAVLTVPEDASAKIRCSRSAGEIRINACGVNRLAGEGEDITINGGEYSISANVSAGNIRIESSSASGGAVTTATNVIASEPEAVGELVESAVDQAMSEVTIYNY
ncbi:MAG: DUF4097 family beta strand repeat-containing protein [Oscillospiraceae bacterium]